MDRRWGARNILTVLMLALVAGGCSSSSKSQSGAGTTTPLTAAPAASSTTAALSSPTTAVCHGAPASSPGISWLPPNLPLPPGSYLAFDSSTDSTHHRAAIDVPDPVTPTVSFITATWAQKGWIVKAAPTPDEPQRFSYTHPRTTLSGLVSVEPLACDQSWSLVTLTLTSH